MASVRAATKVKEETAPDGAFETPRPARAEDIARLMAEAEAQAAARRRDKARVKPSDKPAPKPAPVEETEAAAPARRAGPLQILSIALLWGGGAAALAAGAFLALSSDALTGAGLVFVLGLAVLAGALIAGAATRMFTPALMRGVMLGKPGEAATVQIGGAEKLAALGVAERLLDADADARLVTRRDGVVAFANAAYLSLAREAGVLGAAGLPPRIDRLFSEQGLESTKLFRLFRAAKSAAPAEETIRQLIGMNATAPRRFEVSVRPIAGAEEHVAWRLRELPAEEEERDALAASYADYIRPVFGLEKSGQIAWSNAAMRAKLGVERGELNHINDIILGETAELVRALWQIDQTQQKAKVRRRGADPADAEFTAFRRGGVGEGFVCVELDIEEEPETDEEVSVSGDVTEAPFGVAVIEGEIGRDARIVEANKAFTEVFGGAKKNAPLAKLMAGQTIEELAAEIRRKAASGGAPRPVDALVGEGPSARAFALYARPVRRRRGSYGSRRTFLYSVDVTDRRVMEQEYAQDQKLKAIGRLASEVAHDFNNVLQVVLGKAELLMLRHPAGDPAYMDLVLINQTAQRAANMVKQLLAYSREQTLQREVYSITEILRDFTRFLDGAVGEKVKLELMNGRGLPLIRVDKNQLETAIMNLAVNARDAMGASGGKVSIKTSIVTAEEMAALKINGLAEQEHLLIEVTDTGPGVPSEIRDRIFDPFFTTKAPGKGTGLGLSTVYGIIGQMEGAITVGDADNGGAVFRIYLPAHQGEAVEEPLVQGVQAPADLTGAGRILVVEDEEYVRKFVTTALEDRGYEVTTASDGDEALEMLAEDEAGFDLILSDVMMPEIDGPTLIARARKELGLKAKVIFMSGYAESAVRDQLDSVEGAAYIQKPFTLKGLAVKVKSALMGEAA
ncbi:MAG: response regulator [Parvularculaceae bacterium]